MDVKEIRDEFKRLTKRVVKEVLEPDPIPLVGHLRIATAVRVSPTVIRVTMPRRKKAYAVDNGDGTGSFRGELIGMGF